MRILFCGELSGKWRSGWQRCQSLKDIGNDVIEFHHERYSENSTLIQRVSDRITGASFDEKILERYNHDFLETLRSVKPQVAWLEWPQMLLAGTLKKAKKEMPGCIMMSFQDDNPFGTRSHERPRWRRYLDAIPDYDLHFVKRQSDVIEFKKRGAKRVELFMHGFYSDLFHPVQKDTVPQSSRHDVVFVGTPHDHRVDIINDLLMNGSFSLHVYGGHWNRTLMYYFYRSHFHSHTVNEGYVQILCGAKICLGFVSSSNKDEYTMRTFEIPACKGFFLAERTPTHQVLFEEGKEAEFFDSADECAEKIKFYLANDTAREEIAEAGYRRCIESDYSLQRRVSDAVRILEEFVS